MTRPSCWSWHRTAISSFFGLTWLQSWDGRNLGTYLRALGSHFCIFSVHVVYCCCPCWPFWMTYCAAIRKIFVQFTRCLEQQSRRSYRKASSKPSLNCWYCCCRLRQASWSFTLTRWLACSCYCLCSNAKSSLITKRACAGDWVHHWGQIFAVSSR